MDSSPESVPAGEPRVVQTHISTLVFLGDRVYKVHRPVHLPFLDLSTPQLRLIDCQRELELNSRLAPDVYLGILDVLSEGKAVDHVLVMRRLPEDRRLASMVRSGTVAEADIESLARCLASFHDDAVRSPLIDHSGERDSVAARWEEEFTQTDRFTGTLLDPRVEERLRGLARRFLAGRKPLFDQRIVQGHIVDGHGDLMAEDIFCLEDGPRILDCLEFDDQLRHCDRVADLSFLVMDLLRLGTPSLARALTEGYEEFSGAPVPVPLLWFSCAARAYIRAKVACLGHIEGLPGRSQEAAVLQQLALECLERSRVAVVLVGGAPGTGKSTLARSLSAETGGVVLRSDEIRREILGSAGLEDRYGEAADDRVYSVLLDRARIALGTGERVILDATWRSEDHRRSARRLAEECFADPIELHCVVPLPIAQQRVTERGRRGEDPSEATARVARRLAEVFEPWPEALEIDTSGDGRVVVSAALIGLGPPGVVRSGGETGQALSHHGTGALSATDDGPAPIRAQADRAR